MVGPIEPNEVQNKKDEQLPEEVFIVFNDIIIENWDGHSATVMQDEVAKRIAKALKITTTQVYNRNLLDVENAYTKAGWKVEYDKPGYNEDYRPYFIFSK